MDITNLLNKAKAVWCMKNSVGGWQFPLELEQIRNVSFAYLENEELAEAEKRGLTGDVCKLQDGCLSLNAYRAVALRPQKNNYSIYMRVKNGQYLFSSDCLSLVWHFSGYLFACVSQEIPTGCTYREIPLAKVSLEGWCDCILTIDENYIRFYLNGEKKCETPLLWPIKPSFLDDFLIGGRRYCKPDTYGTTNPCTCSDSVINTFAIWQYCLNEEEIAMLSGCEKLTCADLNEDTAVVCRAYNAFFDASAQGDVKVCKDLYAILRKYAVTDASRPKYHLTQPFGLIYDPVGAYWYDNKYHVFSYRNSSCMLEYASLDHYVSEDLLHWTEYPIGPFADSDKDIFCIYLMNHFFGR